MINRQTIHLSGDYDATKGYRLQLTADDKQCYVKLTRNDAVIGTYPFTLTPKSRLALSNARAVSW